jgi:hypothetical protein
MLLPTEVLRQKINSFFLGFGTFSQSLIIASGLEERDFRSIWKEEKENFIRKAPDYLKNYNEVEYNSKISPKSIYDFLYKNNSATIFFNSDDAIKILKSTSCIKLIEGAVCSSPDSGSKWSVSYENYKSFRFNGYIIMHIKIRRIKWNLSKYHYLLRDVVITDLDEFATRINKLEKSINK